MAANSTQAQTVTGTFTGTYSSNPDGTGTVTTALDAGITVTFATVVTDGGQGLQLVATNCFGGCSIGGDTMISGVARAAYAGSTSFTFIGLTGTSGQPNQSRRLQ